MLAELELVPCLLGHSSAVTGLSPPCLPQQCQHLTAGSVLLLVSLQLMQKRVPASLCSNRERCCLEWTPPGMTPEAEKASGLAVRVAAAVFFTWSCFPTGSSTPEEMVALLVRAGLFDTAITLCQTFKLPLTPVFEGLTFKYVAGFCSLWGRGEAPCCVCGVHLTAAPTCLHSVAAKATQQQPLL